MRGPWLLIPMLGCSADVLELGDGAVDAGRRDAGRRDAGQLADAAQPADGGIASDWWTLESTQGWLETGGFYYAGSTAYVRLQLHPENVCVHGGPVDVEAVGDGALEVRPHVWVHHFGPEGFDPCPGITDQATRDVALPELAPGFYDVVEPISGSRVTVEIYEAPPCAPAGSECNSDCGCASGLECIPNRQAPGRGHCGISCSPVTTGCCGEIQPHRDLECPPEMFCDDDGLATGICRPHTSDPCLLDSECPPGMRCPVTDVPRGCIWAVELNASVRHPCNSSSECDAGLVCVERGSQRLCEVPCFTNEMACPIMHACSPEKGWVCEWFGE